MPINKHYERYEEKTKIKFHINCIMHACQIVLEKENPYIHCTVNESDNVSFNLSKIGTKVDTNLVTNVLKILQIMGHLIN